MDVANTVEIMGATIFMSMFFFLSECVCILVTGHYLHRIYLTCRNWLYYLAFKCNKSRRQWSITVFPSFYISKKAMTWILDMNLVNLLKQKTIDAESN